MEELFNATIKDENLSRIFSINLSTQINFAISKEKVKRRKYFKVYNKTYFLQKDKLQIALLLR